VALTKRVVAVVVSYNPNVSGLVDLLEALLSQVTHAVVVDNASLSDVSSILIRCSSRNVELLQMPENFGIAAAQNAGIERALKLEADFVLLLDQDSIPSATMVSELIFAITCAQSQPNATPVAAVGPVIVDRRTRRTYYFRIDRMGIPGKWTPPISGTQFPKSIEVAVLVASGTLIPIGVIQRIGAMRSNYFINHVDTEWCFRAKAEGYRLLGVPIASLEHQFGDAVKQFWFFGSRQVIYHSPLRNYYDIRNTLLMLHNTAMSWIWKVHFMWRLVRLGYFLVFGGERRLRVRLMTLGLVHALTGLDGRFETKTNRCCVVPVSSIEPNFRTRYHGKARSGL
jgi:rhamnosyltransferase